MRSVVAAIASTNKLAAANFAQEKGHPIARVAFCFSASAYAACSDQCTVKTTGATNDGLFWSSELTQTLALYLPTASPVALKVTVVVPLS